MRHINSSNRISFFNRLKFAWYAFHLMEIEIYFPYKKHCDLRTDYTMECDNKRRSSKCKNNGTVALANPTIKIEKREADHFYHVCDECANKYIGTYDGEE